MLRRKKTGAVPCASCGTLVGVNDERCYQCGRRNPGLFGFGPALRRLGADLGFVTLALWGCGALYLITLVLSGSSIRMSGLFTLLSPNRLMLFLFGASGAIPVFEYDRWWTVLSAGWLHGGLLHILFNLLWLRQLAPAVADMYGAGRMVILYTVAGVCGFALSSAAGYYLEAYHLPRFLVGAQFTVGASASIFGLLGALVLYGRRAGSSVVHGQAWGFVLPLFLFGLVMPGIDNYAHLGGFFGGYLLARLLDPLKPERTDHLLVALICILASVASVVLSVIHGLSLFWQR